MTCSTNYLAIVLVCLVEALVDSEAATTSLNDDTTTLPASSESGTGDLTGVEIFGIVVGVAAILGLILTAVSVCGCYSCCDVIFEDGEPENINVQYEGSVDLKVNPRTRFENIFKVPLTWNPLTIKWRNPSRQEIKGSENKTTCVVENFSTNGTYRCLVKSNICSKLRPYRSKNFTLTGVHERVASDANVIHESVSHQQRRTREEAVATEADMSIQDQQVKENAKKSVSYWDDVDETVLDQEYHWNEVCLALKPLAADWKNVGQALGISKYKINEIAANNPTSVVNALSDVIQQWCGQNYKTDMFGHPSWHTLIRNLDADHKVGEDKVFLKEIAAKHKGIN